MNHLNSIYPNIPLAYALHYPSHMNRRNHSLILTLLFNFLLGLSVQAQSQLKESWDATNWLTDKRVSTTLIEAYKANPKNIDQLPFVKVEGSTPVIEYNSRIIRIPKKEIAPKPTVPGGQGNPGRLLESGWGNSSGGDGVACFDSNESKLQAQSSLESLGYLTQADKERIQRVHFYDTWEMQNPEWIFQDVYLMALLLTDSITATVLDPYDQLFTLVRSFSHPDETGELENLVHLFLDSGFEIDAVTRMLADALSRPKSFQNRVQQIESHPSLSAEARRMIIQVISLFRKSCEKKILSLGPVTPLGLSLAASSNESYGQIHAFLQSQVPALRLRLQLYEQSYPQKKSWRPARLADVKDSCDDIDSSTAVDAETKLSCQYHNQFLKKHPTCLKIQLVNRISNSKRDGSLPYLSFHYDRWLVDNKMSPLDQELLKYHEYTYALGSEVGHTNSDKIRRIIRTQMHPMFSEILTNYRFLTSAYITSSALFHRILGDYVFHSNKVLTEIAEKASSKALMPQLYMASTRMFQKIQKEIQSCSLSNPDIAAVAAKYGISQLNQSFCAFYFHEFKDKNGFFTDIEALIYTNNFLLRPLMRVYNPENLMTFDLVKPNELPEMSYLELNKSCDFLFNAPRLEPRQPEFTGSLFPMIDQAKNYCRSLPFEIKNPLFIQMPEMEGTVDLKTYYDTTTNRRN